MEKLLIQGPSGPLVGEVTISGAKNSALPILFSTILSNGPIHLTNVPELRDIYTSKKILEELGATCEFDRDKNTIFVDPTTINNTTASYDLVKTMRASIVALGPLLARFHEARISLPGGCALGARPVNLHIEGLKAMGATISIEDGYINASSNGRLKGANFFMDTVTVTGTANLMMAATLATGKTVLENAAKEPEVIDLANFLNSLGAKIEGAGTDLITITGVESLTGGTYAVCPDRIETGTFLVAAAITGGKVRCLNTTPDFLHAVLLKLEQAGADVSYGDDWVQVDMQGKTLEPVHIKTQPYPGFPTDMQAQFTLLNAVAEGVGTVTETIFENRFMHVPELNRLGAQIEIEGHTAICKTTSSWSGANVMATDLRASACLLLAALICEGTTTIERIYHLDRGYERIEEKLKPFGIEISRLQA